ncbi:MAG: hypothetical protein QNJ91_12975 [Gammaproteobacteria bacterium]|nr:hypothetical protein [Gammaproteobacteria bacterium]
MPLTDDELRDVQGRVMRMLVDTINTFETIGVHADGLFGDRAPEVRAAINEYLDDFWRNTAASGETHPEVLIYEAPRENFQKAGFYGAQLDLKERQVTAANGTLRERIVGGARQLWRRPFRKWVDIINNFLGSLASATGLSEALKELKDCLRDELPDDDD